MDTAHCRPEDEALREQAQRFVVRKVEPHALAWEATCHTPLEVLLKMGQAGMLGLIISGLLRTDMASPHPNHAGTPAQLARWMPGIPSGQTITAAAICGVGYKCGMAIGRLWRDARVQAIGGCATEVVLYEAAKRY